MLWLDSVTVWKRYDAYCDIVLCHLMHYVNKTETLLMVKLKVHYGTKENIIYTASI